MKCRKKIYLVVSHHNSIKSIITKCIAKHENVYVQYNDFDINTLFTPFTTITLPWVKGNKNFYQPVRLCI